MSKVPRSVPVSLAESVADRKGDTFERWLISCCFTMSWITTFSASTRASTIANKPRMRKGLMSSLLQPFFFSRVHVLSSCTPLAWGVTDDDAPSCEEGAGRGCRFSEGRSLYYLPSLAQLSSISSQLFRFYFLAIERVFGSGSHRHVGGRAPSANALLVPSRSLWCGWKRCTMAMT